MLQSTAQELFVIDPISPASQLPADDDIHSAKEQVLEVVEMTPVDMGHMKEHKHSSDEPLEVSDPSNIEIVVEDLPGALNPEPLIEVQDEPSLKVEEKDDDNEAKKSKKPEKWDWEAHGPHGFVMWIKSRLDDVPKHSGQDSAGLQRAIAYMEKLDNEISKAMRMDLDGELDANKVEEIRSKIDDGLSRLQDRLDKVVKSKKSNRKKKGEEEQEGLVKEGQKILGVSGVYATIPYLIFTLARVCINSMVSAGHSIDYVYHEMCKKHKLDDREKYELNWLLFDMGLAIRGDRGFVAGEKNDLSSSDNYDYAASYPA